jgi:hypothetical protein
MTLKAGGPADRGPSPLATGLRDVILAFALLCERPPRVGGPCLRCG